MVAKSLSFLGLYFYICPVLEGDTDTILAVDCHEIRKAVPERGLKLGHT